MKKSEKGIGKSKGGDFEISPQDDGLERHRIESLDMKQLAGLDN